MTIKEMIGTERFNNIKKIANAYLGKAGKLTDSLVEDLLDICCIHYEFLNKGLIYWKYDYFRNMNDIDIGSDIYGVAYNKGITFYGKNIGLPKGFEYLYDKLDKAIKRR